MCVPSRVYVPQNHLELYIHRYVPCTLRPLNTRGNTTKNARRAMSLRARMHACDGTRARMRRHSTTTRRDDASNIVRSRACVFVRAFASPRHLDGIIGIGIIVIDASSARFR